VQLDHHLQGTHNQLIPERIDVRTELRKIFDRQRESLSECGTPSYRKRMEDLAKLSKAVADRRAEMVSSAIRDFGSRSRHEILMSEIFPIFTNLRYTMKHLRSWMRQRRRRISPLFKPAAGSILYQPKGVVGIISPWNYPFQLTIIPFVAALAAGNRIMIKPSENSPAASAMIDDLLSDLFPSHEVAVCRGDAKVGEAFARLPFGHLLFTGSTRLGRAVMKEVADNLTPVTLQLGGKSPMIIHRSFPLERAVKRLIMGKLLNAGQTCVAVDYVFIPIEKRGAFVELVAEKLASFYPTVAKNSDYTSIISESEYERLESYIADARAKGAKVIEINPAEERSSQGKMLPTLLLDVNDSMSVMQEEIMGPLLPVKTYREIDEVLQYVNSHPKPLALYYFDYSRRRIASLLERTSSGGACINDTLIHTIQDDLPFSGIGDSGMGAYHGFEGFEAFSHKRAVFRQARANLISLLTPPYGKRADRFIRLLVGAD
jgi:coniferyl-aldehyde dehydrogenase